VKATPGDCPTATAFRSSGCGPGFFLVEFLSLLGPSPRLMYFSPILDRVLGGDRGGGLMMREEGVRVWKV